MLRLPTFPRAVPFVGIAALLAAAVGCGGASTATVSGTVTLDNGPLPGGKITFISATANRGTKEFFAVIDREGQYTISEVPLGPVKVKVETEHLNLTKGFGGKDPSQFKPPKVEFPKELRDKMKDQADNLRKAEEAQKQLTAKMPIYKRIPAKYTNPDKSGLSAEITERTQTGLNFALSSK